MDRLEKQMQFIKTMDGLKQITRQTYLSDASRKENDAEHSWHLALMAILLKEYANEDINLLRVISMVLFHDTIELEAGDTYAYDAKGNETKREREVAAADKLFHILPDDQAEYIRGLWDEFEERKTIESQFAHTLDNIQPIMLNAASNGKSWREHEVKLSQILKRNEQSAKGSKVLWDYANSNYVIPNVEAGNIKKEK